MVLKFLLLPLGTNVICASNSSNGPLNRQCPSDAHGDAESLGQRTQHVPGEQSGPSLRGLQSLALGHQPLADVSQLLEEEQQLG